MPHIKLILTDVNTGAERLVGTYRFIQFFNGRYWCAGQVLVIPVGSGWRDLSDPSRHMYDGIRMEAV
jgi:hypothetical protein